MAIKTLLVFFILTLFYSFVINDTSETNEFVSPVLKTRRPFNRFSFSGKSYYVNNVVKGNFFLAWQFCRQQDMHVLSIKSQEESDKIAAFLRNNDLNKDRYWTSGTNLGDENAPWMWLSTGKKLSYTNWDSRQPNNLNETENCIEARFSENNDFKWNDEDCWTELYVICESVPDCKR